MPYPTVSSQLHSHAIGLVSRQRDDLIERKAQISRGDAQHPNRMGRPHEQKNVGPCWLSFSPWSHFWRQAPMLAQAPTGSQAQGTIRGGTQIGQPLPLSTPGQAIGADASPLRTVGSGMAGPAVALLSALYDPAWTTEVKNRLLASGKFSAVGTFAVASMTPSLAQLSAYDAVFVFSDAPFFSRAGLGDVLADYVDTGRGVVLATFSFSTDYGSLQGRFATGGYYAVTPVVGQTSGPATLGSVLVPSHPVMGGALPHSTEAVRPFGMCLRLCRPARSGSQTGRMAPSWLLRRILAWPGGWT